MIALVKKQILNDRQRKEIKDYLLKRPNKMPAYVRGLRMTARTLNFDQMREDLVLLEELAILDIQIGRKSSAYKELHAQMMVRHRGEENIKAVLEVRK